VNAPRGEQNRGLQGDTSLYHRHWRRVDLLAEVRRHSKGAGKAFLGHPGLERLGRLSSARQRELPSNPHVDGDAEFSDMAWSMGQTVERAIRKRSMLGQSAPLIQTRDLRAIDPVFAATQAPCVIPRRGCVIVNLPPARAIITMERCYFVPLEGADEDLHQFVRRVSQSAMAAEEAEKAAVKAAEEAEAELERKNNAIALGTPPEPSAVKIVDITADVSPPVEDSTEQRPDDVALVAAAEGSATDDTPVSSLKEDDAALRPSAMVTDLDEKHAEGSLARPKSMKRAPKMAGLLPWELHVLEALLLTVTSHMRRDLDSLAPRAKNAVTRLHLAGRSESRTCSDLTRDCCGKEGLFNCCCSCCRSWNCCCCCRGSRAPTKRSRFRARLGNASTGMLAEMSSVRRELRNVQSRGEALAGCLEGLLESPQLLARLNLTALAESLSEQRMMMNRKSRALNKVMVGSPDPLVHVLDKHGKAWMVHSSQLRDSDPVRSPVISGSGLTRPRQRSEASGTSDSSDDDEESVDYFPPAPTEATSNEDDQTDFYYGDAVELLIESYYGEVGAVITETRRLQSDIETAERQLSLQLASSRNALLRVDVTVSIVTVALALLSAISGFMGMNVSDGVPDTEWVFGRPFFYIVLGSSLFAAIITLVVLAMLQRVMRTAADG
jgi:CHASE3 domain sensor protein